MTFIEEHVDKPCLYQVKNELNGMVYIGACSRIQRLVDGYRGSGPDIRSAIDESGLENFSWSVLQLCSTHEEALELEAEIVDRDFTTREDTYNKRVGGSGWTRGHMLSDEAKKNHSEAMRKRPLPENFTFDWTGRKHAEESKKKMSESSRGKKPWNVGVPHSEETKKKISLKLKGRKQTAKRKPLSQESRLKMSESAKRAWQRRKQNSN